MACGFPYCGGVDCANCHRPAPTAAKPDPFWIARIAAGHAPRFQSPGESVEDYRVAMGWNQPKNRFEKTYCSQCGGEFGPGDHGYSHCSDHGGETPCETAMAKAPSTSAWAATASPFRRLRARTATAAARGPLAWMRLTGCRCWKQPCAGLLAGTASFQPLAACGMTSPQ